MKSIGGMHDKNKKKKGPHKRPPTLLKRKSERKLKRQLKKQAHVNHFKRRALAKKGIKVAEFDNSGPPRPINEKKDKNKNKRKMEEEEMDLKTFEEEQKEQRKQRLMEDNEEEEAMMKKLEKDLGIRTTKTKGKKLPKSFLDDGLDFLLGTSGDLGFGGLEEDDNQEKKIYDLDGSENEESGSDIENDVVDGENGALDDTMGTDEEILDEQEEFDGDALEGADDNESENESDDGEDFEDENGDMEEENMDKDSVEDNLENDQETEDGEEETWEDIYGRTRTKDGRIIDDRTKNAPSSGTLGGGGGKYIPPALRNAGGEDKKKCLERLKKQLKGNLNRLAESNMHSIAAQIENMYRQNSRNDMNETLFALITEAIISPVLTPERLVTEYAMLITILHANIGSEVGAHFVEEFNNLLFQKYREIDLDSESGKELDNTVMMLSYIFNFKIIDSKYMFDILLVFTESFKQKDIELILGCLRTSGFNMRKSDPIAMKNLITQVQSKATSCASTDARVQFMLEVLLAVKNNNVNKIPNYDTTHFEHLRKTLKIYIRDGNFVSVMKIGLKDLEKADTLGRWWVVGSYYAGNLVGTNQQPPEDQEAVSGSMNNDDLSEELLQLARKMRMNTDSRKKIFCLVMSSEDYLDATEKIVKLGLKNQTERDVMFVLLDCSIQEKTFNPFYCHLSIKLSSVDRKYKIANQFCIWDKLKLTSEMEDYQTENLAKYISLLVRMKSQSIAVLRTIHFAEMNKYNVKLLRLILCEVLLKIKTEELTEIFSVVGRNEKYGTFGESLKLFLNHFLLKKRKYLDQNINFEKLEKRVRVAEDNLGSRLRL